MYGLFCLAAEALKRLWHWLTVRRIVQIVAIVAILILIRGAVPVPDLAVLMGVDWGVALEVFGALMILGARTHTISTIRFLRHTLSAAKSRLRVLMHRGVTRAGRTRPETPPPSSDEDGGFYWATIAMA